MKKNVFQIFIVAIIIILIGVLISFSQKRKPQFELVKSEAKQILKLIDRAGDLALEAEKAAPNPLAYGIFFNFDRAILFADKNENKIFDDEIISEYQLKENIRLNQAKIVYYIPHKKDIEFCDQSGQCHGDLHPTVGIADIKTGRAMEFRFEQKTGKVELREVVDSY
ncbi:MAG: hypothetical protein ACOZBH_03635 [Patescibacteria group bacterium]